MDSSGRYDLFTIFNTIKRNRRTLFVFLIIAALISVILSFIFPPQYEADSVFILKNPVYADRNNVYSYEAKFLDYTANDDDVDRFIAMASSDTLQNTIIRRMHLATAYDYDSTDPEEVYKLKRYFKKHLRIYRNEYKNIVLVYKDKDPERAAKIANLCVDMLDQSLRGFYNEMRHNMYRSIMDKVHEEDSTITYLTDTLTKLREQYGIYDIISPSRYNIMLSSVKGNGQPGFAKGLELIQNIESVKDELVGDRAKHISLANQYSTGINLNEMNLTHIIQKAKAPFKHPFLNILKVLGLGSLLALMFGVVYILAADYYKRIVSKMP
jgi:capsular polysaccharide biosynthesis protein